MFPDGGLMRVKAFGQAVAPQPPEAPITQAALLQEQATEQGA